MMDGLPTKVRTERMEKLLKVLSKVRNRIHFEMGSIGNEVFALEMIESLLDKVDSIGTLHRMERERERGD